MGALDAIKRDLSAVDASAVLIILLNMSSSIGTVFSNKWAFQHYSFPYYTALVTIHLMVLAVGLQACAMLKVFRIKHLPILQILPLAMSFCGFVLFTNASLKHNSVGFYQVMKVLTTPVIIVIQALIYDVHISGKAKLAMVGVCGGVAITAMTDVTTTLVGTGYAVLGVLVTSFYQIVKWVGHYQRKYEVNSLQLLYYQAPLAAGILFALCPFIEDVPHFFQYPMDSNLLFVLFLSCCASFFVNVSTFMLIGKTSAVTYNAVGHCKLCIVILGGFLLFGQSLTPTNLVGTLITIVSLIYYTHVKLQAQAHSAKE